MIMYWLLYLHTYSTSAGSLILKGQHFKWFLGPFIILLRIFWVSQESGRNLATLELDTFLFHQFPAWSKSAPSQHLQQHLPCRSARASSVARRGNSWALFQPLITTRSGWKSSKSLHSASCTYRDVSPSAANWNFDLWHDTKIPFYQYEFFNTTLAFEELDEIQ